MKVQKCNRRPSRLRRVAIAIVASGTVAVPAVYAKPLDSDLLVPPADLPEAARHGGEAMLLRQTLDGRTFLYIEQNQGARLAILDVTDPGFVRAERSVKLQASGAFDFISALGNWAELVRFRQSQVDAVLDLHDADAPMLTRANQQQTAHDTNLPSAQDGAPKVDPAAVEVSNDATGTTFLLTQDGLYLIRQRDAEMLEKWRELAYAN